MFIYAIICFISIAVKRELRGYGEIGTLIAAILENSVTVLQDVKESYLRTPQFYSQLYIQEN